MSEMVIKIANTITILSILGFGTYIWIERLDAKYRLMFSITEAFKGNYYPIKWLWNHKFYLCIYPIVAIIYGIGLILLSQFYNGVLRIRLEWQIVLSAALWVLMIIKEKSAHEMMCRFTETIQDLKEKLSKYE